MNRLEKLSLITRYFYKSSIKDLWFQKLNSFIQGDMTILEIGSGSGRGNQNRLYPDSSKIYGIDLDERVLNNPYLFSAKCISAYQISENFESINFDIIYSHMVVEHIDNPSYFLINQFKKLKEDGVLIHSTVSKFYWVSLLNNILNENTKYFLIKNLGSGRKSNDIFPAFYRLNSRKSLEKLSKIYNFNYEIIRQDEPPGYLRRSLILMLIYTIINKPLQFLFPCLKPTFIFIIKKNKNTKLI